MQLVLALLFITSIDAASKCRRSTDYGVEAEKVNNRGCSNLTVVLDNWKYAIMTQVKDLLLNDHSTVLPDYSRIGPLSEALGDIYKEFNSLKGRLGELTAKFEGVESFVDEIRLSRKDPPRPEGHTVESSEPLIRQRRKNRVVIRKVVKIENPHM